MTIASGRSFPLGATVVEDGVNFCVFSRKASAVELLLFDGACDPEPARVIRLDASRHRTYYYWHAFVPGLRSGQVYAYRALGPFDPARGIRFDPARVLLDPYGRAVVVPDGYDRLAASRPGDNTKVAMRSAVVDPDAYDWEGDAPLRRPFATTVIYEVHVGGFTRHPSSGVAREKRGTYAGMIEKIPYLQDRGITAVELLPVFQFDSADCPSGLINYWGYSPVSFFAPHTGYSSRRDPLRPVDEFRSLVKALHRAGIEVILDVVYNHTAEGNHDGPTLCFRGLDNETYYLLQPDRARYSDYTGTGNTLNANDAVVRRLIVDSLKYWVPHMHVDGFRFDLASVLSRDESGRPLSRAPVLWDIESDPVLAGTKLIAEAWDAAGLYQVGSFGGDAWQEWNGKFRDDVRRFVKSDNESVLAFAQRCFGSPDLYAHEDRGPEQSINFITSHDGFTLNDLVSYNVKHNESNAHGGRDGSDVNFSWNCGVEGPSADPDVERLRQRQVKNFLAIMLLSLGTPMLLMGDDGWITDLGQLRRLTPLAADAGFLDDFRKAKHAAKNQFADWLRTSAGLTVDPETIFDSQVKRIHEYKRQLLNGLRIVVLYNRLRENPGLSMTPRTFFFAGKAAPAYHLAKVIIKFLNNLAGTIDGDPAVRGRLKVLFLPEYCVSLAERLIPASDVSNQISTGGYEASGTSNMKFMMNGALTIGTRDGATIEMAQEAGEENFFLFGLTAEQVAASRDWYSPHWHYDHEPETRAALDLIFSDYFSRNEPGAFAPLRDALLTAGDHYMHLADLTSYLEADRQLEQHYTDSKEWTHKAILNVAASGKFSSDRTIAEYAAGIWDATPCPVE